MLIAKGSGGRLVGHSLVIMMDGDRILSTKTIGTLSYIEDKPFEFSIVLEFSDGNVVTRLSKPQVEKALETGMTEDSVDDTPIKMFTKIIYDNKMFVVDVNKSVSICFPIEFIEKYVSFVRDNAKNTDMIVFTDEELSKFFDK